MMPLASTRALSEFAVPTFPAFDEAEEREREREARRRELAARVRAAGVPERFRGARLADCDPAVRRWAEAVAAGTWEGDPFLLLLGKNGRGKTHQAAAALMALLRDRDGLFAEAPQIVGELSENYGKFAEPRLLRYKAAGVLFIDELGKERFDAKTAPWLFDLVQRRWSMRRPTIVASNMDSDGLALHFAACGEPTMGRSIISRIGSGAVVRLEGRDRRFSAASPGRAEP